jgi:hypothetical protein
VVALAQVIKLIQAVGFDQIIEHETKLTAYALRKLNQFPEIVIYGDHKPKNAKNRLGVISFNIKDMHHALVSAILSYEGGIGVRNGCFCAHPYVKCLLGVGPEQAKRIEKMIINRDRSEIPGAVRISFGIYNTKKEIDELIEIARKMREGDAKQIELGLKDDELAFYDALAQNESALQVLGDEQLAFIAREVLQKVRENATIDWKIKESVRAKLRLAVKSVLNRYGYPPDMQQSAVDNVIKQAEMMSEEELDDLMMKKIFVSIEK